MNIHKIRVESFEPYGLNKYKNFLSMEGLMSATSEEEVIGWAEGVLSSTDIDGNIAIFIHTAKDNMYAIVREYDWEEDNYYIDKYISEGDMDFFAMVDADLDLSAYGLIMQLNKTTWSIVNF